MFRINCPHCGHCDVTEFAYGPNATLQRPEESADPRDWYDYVYNRPNPKGPNDEFWHHVHGCRQWIKVRRDTVTHEILSTATATGELEGGQ
ncbi:sarcosine oxidase subunit delta [Aestuariispira ectoiniformans]|uniref:sarcosine oxidase subunit delta n=1 Tax=Aestuariispira ectoiniformans TaxID=2775080 RepID=UPI00223C43F1|nr:sarcosine oxidase subunit delta [Aestuariispira ectoiniformans]